MAANLDSVELKPGQWTDIYDETGIEYGTKVAVQNIGSSDIRLTTALLQPEPDSDSFQRAEPNDMPMVNDAGDPGAWAMSPNQYGKINVWVIP